MMSSPASKLFSDAIAGKTKDERTTKASEFAAQVVKAGVALSFHELKLNDVLEEQFNKGGKSGAVAREGAMLCVVELCKQDRSAYVLLLPILSAMLELQGDKVKPVAAAAKEACDAVIKSCDENMVGRLLPELLKTVHSVQGNVSRFEGIVAVSEVASIQTSTLLDVAIAAVVPFVVDIKKEVAEAAQQALKALCETCPNPDMELFLPELEVCLKDQKMIPATVFKMASSTLVAEVDSSTLAIMAPVLTKGLQTISSVVIKRQCARIIENMCKLVEEPRYLNGFLVKILPLLDSAKLSIPDQEARAVCAKASEILVRKGAEATSLVFDLTRATAAVQEASGEVRPHFQPLMAMMASQCVMLNENRQYSVEAWVSSVAGLATTSGMMEAKEAEEMVEKLRMEAKNSRVVIVAAEVDDAAEILCDLEFGLAYGNKVLLRKTKLKLLRGHRYGLLGQNDSGKTTLLNALADYRIEGFPTASECRTVFVATDIKTDLADLSVIDYMFHDPLLKDCGVSREDMEKRLESVGFKEGAPANTTQKVGTLSGGWRMKLALSRAMLLNADILLLDEPTNHLDTYNVKWVESYLLSLTNVTCIMVSHDSGLLTRVCTDMVEIADYKLKYHRGNLASLVEARPEARCYMELADEGKYDFTFPNPGPLPGITSKGKAILRMDAISFTYPGVTKAQLTNVSVQVSLSSRVACVGENGAGKSTMIKLLTGELEPDAGSGVVYKHPNCRVGYIAQHAFHHIENHLEETANDYIRWRYATGADREELVKVTHIPTAEETKLMEEPWEMCFPQDDGTVLKRKVVVSRFTERRREIKTPKGMEYELEYQGSSTLFYVDREVLVKRGWEKPLKQLDERIAIRATQFARPLSKENVEKHLSQIGLSPEFGTHMPIGALSGGQKVKVVLAASLWCNPHVLILDEPTNYLDRESLGALARAIRKFEGGVVMITHNSQFCDNLCPVVWHLQNNTLDVKGDAEWMAEAAKAAIKVVAIDESELVDKFGNTIERKTIKKLTTKELKAKKLRRAKRTKETGDDYDSDEE